MNCVKAVKNNLAIIFGLIYSVIYSLILFSCQPQAPIGDAIGDVKILIPLTQQSTSENSVKNLTQNSVVTIKNIHNLNEVFGNYAQFYFTPESAKDSLAGTAPKAQFIRTQDNVYVPSNTITQQMFSIYYHIQNLNDYSFEISTNLKQKIPFSVGLNTLVSGNQNQNDSNAHNNAFYDGESNALLFVPYTLKQIPIAVNAGIIAHEFFHSIFFKSILKNFNFQQDNLFKQFTKTDAALNAYYFNQTLVRGINEGLADYWGWVYTTSTDYISDSLPQYGASRKLELSTDRIGLTETKTDIEQKVNEARAVTLKPNDYLSAYIYKIGTPHARYLKELTLKIQSEKNLDLVKAKLLVSKAVYKYLLFLSSETSLFTSTSELAADHMFQYFSHPEKSELKLTKSQCEFTISYLKLNQTALKKAEKICTGQNE